MKTDEVSIEFQLPHEIMASIYKLVAERRDRNQRMKRNRKDWNVNLSRGIVEKPQPGKYFVEQPKEPKLRTLSWPTRRPTHIVLRNVNRKVDVLMNVVDELSNRIKLLNTELITRRNSWKAHQ